MSSRGHAVRNVVIGALFGGLVMSMPFWLPDYFRTFWSRLHHSVTTLLALQPSEEPPIRDLFVVFLVIFVMMGLMPLLDKLVVRISKYLKSRVRSDMLVPGQAKGEPENLPVEPAIEQELYDFEIIILRSLAQAGWKGLSLKHIAADLHLDPLFAEQTLISLQNSGLVVSLDLDLFGKRFFLSGQGREYAKRQGFMASF